MIKGFSKLLFTTILARAMYTPRVEFGNPPQQGLHCWQGVNADPTYTALCRVFPSYPSIADCSNKICTVLSTRASRLQSAALLYSTTRIWVLTKVILTQYPGHAHTQRTSFH